MPSEIEPPEIPEGNLSVTAGEIRDITERLFHTASGISLAEWSPMANNLLGAASRIEQHESLLSDLRKLAGEWRTTIDINPYIGQYGHALEDCADELSALIEKHGGEG